jgi:GPI ethanolamine phosphate transferase 1
LTLYFFWVVKDEGSWLEIGSTISHFVIASVMCIFVAALEGVSAMFIAGVEVGGDVGKAVGSGAVAEVLLERANEAVEHLPKAGGNGDSGGAVGK